MAPIRVILVDDSPDITGLYRRLVDSEPDMCCVGTLGSATGLEQLARGSGADVVVVDLSMPGPEPLEAIRALVEQSPGCRVVAFSGYDDEQTASAAYSAGAWGLVSKHDSPEALLVAIRRVAAGGVAFGRTQADTR
ncbi:MAG TPA: response regulator transcription factor [Phycisphaerales bacterium]|nr:response regulator transcription factor [Phycisphaerales bacterium]